MESKKRKGKSEVARKNGARSRVVARRAVYKSQWVSVYHVDLELPDGQIARRIHLVDYAHQASSVVPTDGKGNLLLIDHYRFQTDTRGWEVPAGKIDRGETPVQAARREMIEETGHQIGGLKKLGRYHPSNGSSNQVFHVFVGRVQKKLGAIPDTNEVSAARWFSENEVRRLIAQSDSRWAVAHIVVVVFRATALIPPLRRIQTPPSSDS